MKNNKGFTLVELLITVVILAIVIISATGFMLSGSRSFAKGSADAGVQSEAELAVNQIEDMVIDVNGGVDYVKEDAAGTETLVLYHAEADSSGVTVYKKRNVQWNKNDNDIKSSEWIVADDGSGTYVETSNVYQNQLLASNVTAFNVDLSDTIKEKDKNGNDIDIVRSVVIRVDCKDASGKSAYATTPVITLRNRMMLSGNPSAIFPNVPTPDDTLALYISSTGMEGAVPIRDRVTTVERGKNYNIFAMVNATTNVNSLCDWKVEGEASGYMSSMSAETVYAVLEVHKDEPNEYLIITASYKDNPAKKAVGIVKVIGGANKSLDACKILPYKMTQYEPYYKSTVTWQGFTTSEVEQFEYTWSVDYPEKVETFAEHNKDLQLKVKEEYRSDQNTGRILRITLVVYSPTTNQSVSDSVDYLIGGDYLLERGKRGNWQEPFTDDWKDDKTDGYHKDNWYWFDLPSKGQGDQNFCKITGYEIYVCDINGNRISSKDYLTQYFILNVNGGDYGDEKPLNGGRRITYYLTMREEMPPEEEFYLKIKINFRYNDGTDYIYENIHFVSGVYIIAESGSHEGAPNFYNDADLNISYMVEGYYSNSWANKEPLVFAYDVEFDYTAPSGVTLEVKLPSWNNTNVDSSKGEGSKYFKASFGYKITNESGRSDSEVMNEIKINGARVKIYMKDNPNIYGECYIEYKY